MANSVVLTFQKKKKLVDSATENIFNASLQAAVDIVCTPLDYTCCWIQVVIS